MTLPQFGQPIARIDIELADILDLEIVAPAAGDILIYDGDSWDNQPVTGDITITAGGVTAIAAGVIVDADINAAAEIAVSKLGDGDPRQVINTDAAGTAVGWFTPTFDGIVDVGGDGHWTTLQDGDDALDAGPYTMWVKQGTYAAGMTVNTDNVTIFVEPGTVIQGAIILTGDDPTLMLGAGCDIQALITASGANPSIICENGVNIRGVLFSGTFPYFDGGGWGTLSNGGTANPGIEVSAPDAVIKNASFQTTAGGGSLFDAIRLTAARPRLLHCRVVDSDDFGISMGSSAADTVIDGSEILGTDNDGIQLNGPRSRVSNTRVFQAGGHGIAVGTSGDNSTMVGNVVQDQATNSIDIDADAEDCVAVANRLDGAVNDASGTSTVANNDVTAF